MDPARVAALAEFVSSMRGHPFKKPLPPVVLVPESELPALLSSKGRIEQLSYSGRYVEESHRILLADRLENDPDLEPVVVHELVHALMTDYGVSLVPLRGLGDTSLFVTAALIEGEAELVEDGFRGKLHGRRPRRAMAGLTNVHAPFIPVACRSDRDAKACAFADAIYSEGRVFASALYRAGGTALLDAVHLKPPTTTLEILYPELYLRGERERELTGLSSALAATGHPIEQRAHIGALVTGVRLAENGIESGAVRAALRGLRGDETAMLTGRGQLIVTEWADEQGPKRMSELLAKTPLPLVVASPRRLVIGIDVSKDVVAAVAKKLPPQGAAPPAKPPLGHVVAPGRPPWEEELASALRSEGAAGFKLVGVDAGALRRDPTSGDTGRVWLTSADHRLFIFPTADGTPTSRGMSEAFGKAWSDAAEEMTLDASERHASTLGEITLWAAAFGPPAARLHHAVARVPLCGDPTASLLVFEFGTSDAVKASLAKSIDTLRTAKDAARAPLCRRLADEAASEFVPPATF